MSPEISLRFLIFLRYVVLKLSSSQVLASPSSYISFADIFSKSVVYLKCFSKRNFSFLLSLLFYCFFSLFLVWFMLFVSLRNLCLIQGQKYFLLCFLLNGCNLRFNV